MNKHFKYIGFFLNKYLLNWIADMWTWSHNSTSTPVCLCWENYTFYLIFTCYIIVQCDFFFLHLISYEYIRWFITRVAAAWSAVQTILGSCLQQQLITSVHINKNYTVQCYKLYGAEIMLWGLNMLVHSRQVPHICSVVFYWFLRRIHSLWPKLHKFSVGVWTRLHHQEWTQHGSFTLRWSDSDTCQSGKHTNTQTVLTVLLIGCLRYTRSFAAGLYYGLFFTGQKL